MQVNFFVGAFHDAVVLYGFALNETLYAGGDIKDGVNMSHAMWSRSFEGTSSMVHTWTSIGRLQSCFTRIV